MATKKNTSSQKTASHIEEVDLSAINIDALDVTLPTTDTLSSASSQTAKNHDMNTDSDREEDFSSTFDDDFDDDFDDFDDFDGEDDGDETSTEKGDRFKQPKDFFTDKRRQKTLKKFLDVEVPAEFLDGLPEDLQLIFKKGKVEGKLVYDEVMGALPP